MPEPVETRPSTDPAPAAAAAVPARPQPPADPADAPLFTTPELIRAISIAIISALLGFFISCIGGDGKTRAPAPIDRRQAENGAPNATRTTEVSFQAPDDGEKVTYEPYPASKMWTPTVGHGNGIPTVVSSSSATPAASATPAGKPSRTPKPTPTPSPSPSATPTPASIVAVKPAPVPTAPPGGPATTPTPGPFFPDKQPGRGVHPASEARAVMTQSIGRVDAVNGGTVACVLVDNAGLMVTRWSALGGVRRVSVRMGGVHLTADVLGGLGKYDIAVLGLPPSQYAEATLAPEPPDGSPLAYMAISERGGMPRPQTAIPSSSFDGFFIYAGVTDAPEVGEPLVNDHGEVTGLILGRPWSYPGNCANLAVDASVLNFAVFEAKKGTLDKDPSPDVVTARFKTLLERMLAAAPTTPNLNSIVPGQGVGIYRLGMPVDKLQKLLNAFDPPQRLEDPGFEMIRVGGGQQLDFFLMGGRLVAIRTRNPAFTTKRGVGVGALMVNIDARRELGRATQGEWLNGESYVVGPGLEVWGNDDKVLRLVVEGAMELKSSPRGAEL